MGSADRPSTAAISEARKVGAAVSWAMMCLCRASFEKRSPSVFRGRLSAAEASLVCSGSLVIEVSSSASRRRDKEGFLAAAWEEELIILSVPQIFGNQVATISHGHRSTRCSILIFYD